MPLKKLSIIALEALTFGEATKAEEFKKGVIARELQVAIRDGEGLDLFKMELNEVRGHACILEKLTVWHGALGKNRRYRKTTNCQCKCDRRGLCECTCGSLLLKLAEYREAEIFRGKGKQPKKVIKKSTEIKHILLGDLAQHYNL